MTLSKNVKRFGIAAAMGLSMMGLAPANDFAQAATVYQGKLPSQMVAGECISKAAMLAGLDKEGQYILVVNDVIGANSNDGQEILQRSAFTSDKSFERGYAIAENTKGEFCKSADLNSIKVFDARLGQVDNRAYYQPTSFTVTGSLNGALLAIQKNRSQLPMLQATATNGMTITVLSNLQTGAGEELFSDKQGKLNKIGFLETKNTKYSSVALEILNRPQFTASLK